VWQPATAFRKTDEGQWTTVMNADGIGELESAVRSASLDRSLQHADETEAVKHAGGPHFVIEPSSGWGFPNLGEVWRYRELLYFMIWRDVKARFKQTALGVTWAILQPVATMVVFTIFFGWLVGVPSDGVPYPIFTFVALLPWQLFSQAVSQSGGSLVAHRELVTKVYFPRLVIPIAAVLLGIVDFLLAFVVFLAMMLYYGMTPTTAVLAVPFLVLLACLAALAIGLWLAVLNVRYRDVRLTIPYITQLWMFATPIAYPASLVPDGWRMLYALNPMVGVVEGFRWALLGTSETLHPSTYVSAVVVVALLVGGLLYFRRMERTFADEV
jgi:lipopolysaccharide transport system permease protein